MSTEEDTFTFEQAIDALAEAQRVLRSGADTKTILTALRPRAALRAKRTAKHRRAHNRARRLLVRYLAEAETIGCVYRKGTGNGTRWYLG